MAEETTPEAVPYRGSPRRKGIRSILYGLGVLAGTATGGLISLVTIGSAALYSAYRAGSSLYKSFQGKHGEMRGSYFGRGAAYLARTLGTITVPWLQGFASIISGGTRIAENDFHGYDFPNINPYEKRLKEEEAAAAARVTQQTAAKVQSQ